MAQSIRDFALQIKPRAEGFLATPAAADIGILLIILLVGAGSFGLGRLSVDTGINGAGEGISITQAAAVAQAPGRAGGQAAADMLAPIPPGGQLVASKNGSKYYYPWCGGAKTIKQENLIWFPNEEKAKAAGYTPAANCKGL